MSEFYERKIQMTKKEKRIIEALNEYVAACGGSGKGSRRIPNLCGLCRHIGMGKNEMLAILSESERLADTVFTILEDEAVNSGASGTAYTQQFHILDEIRTEISRDGTSGEGITAIFGHPDGEE